MSSSRSVTAHVADVTRLQVLGLRAGRRAWSGVAAGDISGSWQRSLSSLLPVVEGIQLNAAISGSEYGSLSLAELGKYVPPTDFVDPSAFTGYDPNGRPLRGLLESPAYTAKRWIGDGYEPDAAIEAAGRRLDIILRSIVADAARQAASVDLAVRPGVGYVRVIVGETCRDCIVLAGKWFRWNKGFKRHPGCDCIHRPATQALAANEVYDPYAHFFGLSKAEQDRLWGVDDAQAIRDGADIYRVYNADRNRRSAARMTTTAGTTRRGFHIGERLTPDGIYARAKSREEALELLRQHGYLLPGGQVPGGSIRGRYREGYGALGKGGERVGARNAIERARATGERAPGSRYTATAAEKRLIDAEARWSAVRQGRNPFTLNGRGLTPEIAATVERDYRRWLRTGGEYFN